MLQISQKSFVYPSLMVFLSVFASRPTQRSLLFGIYFPPWRKDPALCLGWWKASSKVLPWITCCSCWDYTVWRVFGYESLHGIAGPHVATLFGSLECDGYEELAISTSWGRTLEDHSASGFLCENGQAGW